METDLGSYALVLVRSDVEGVLATNLILCLKGWGMDSD